ncbi:T5orf172 domain [Janthinobacterium lividum]|uniref:GIY-YIG nuclease family protein n=1 Tax=Janthinobacterium lividum TaxID=29581 RepID=UPI000E00E79B|nr:GIY-YIG nuclease family protein [Janthinobacterium lividum]STQ93225.1 T5orf172 domain [Janthinobacterium lividum]
MDSSQLYILKNKSFQRNILKIGMTKKQTNSRAKQLYSGATGVPEPFDVLFACSVADCRTAESIVHRRLAAFRVNNSREFFRIPAKIARQIVLEVCSNLNTERQHDRPIISVDLITTQEPEPPINDQYQEKYGEIFSIPHEEIVQLPIGTTILSKTQKKEYLSSATFCMKSFQNVRKDGMSPSLATRNLNQKYESGNILQKLFLK